MASPHVAGAWALIRECVDGNGNPISNATVVSRLSTTGVQHHRQRGDAPDGQRPRRRHPGW